MAMNLDDHCKITEIIFGKPHRYVHNWLDAFYSVHKSNKHWVHRHHIKAIKEKYGEGTTEYLVAYVHILCDWLVQYAHPFVPKTLEEIEPEMAKCNVALTQALVENF